VVILPGRADNDIPTEVALLKYLRQVVALDGTDTIKAAEYRHGQGMMVPSVLTEEIMHQIFWSILNHQGLLQDDTSLPLNLFRRKG